MVIFNLVINRFYSTIDCQLNILNKKICEKMHKLMIY